MDYFTRKFDAISAMQPGLEQQKKLAESGVVRELWELGPKCFRDRSCLPPVVTGLLFHFRISKLPIPQPENAKAAAEIRESIYKVHHIIKCISFVLITPNGDLITSWDPASIKLIKKLWLEYWKWTSAYIHIYCIRSQDPVAPDLSPLPGPDMPDWAKPGYQVLKDAVQLTKTFHSINNEMEQYVESSSDFVSRLMEAWISILTGKNIPAGEIPSVEGFITDNLYTSDSTKPLDSHTAMELCTRLPDAIPAVLQRLRTSAIGSDELTHTLFFIHRLALTDILRETLLIAKLTRAISSTIRRMLDAPFSVRSTIQTQTALRFFLSYFGSIVKGESKGGGEWIAEALEYQLLYYVREISGQHFHLFPREHHDRLLEAVLQITLRLQLALIYRPVLKQCTRQFVPRLNYDPQKGNLAAWQSTRAVRVKAKELRKKLSLQEGARIFEYKVCANMKCSRQHSISVQTCSGCELIHFCSKQCQKVVWNDYHRRQCPSFQKKRREGSLALPMSDRDLHVLRAQVRLYLSENASQIQALLSSSTDATYPMVVNLTYAPDPVPTPEVTWSVSVASARQFVNRKEQGYTVAPPSLDGWRSVVYEARKKKGKLVYVKVPTAVEDVTRLWFFEDGR